MYLCACSQWSSRAENNGGDVSSFACNQLGLLSMQCIAFCSLSESVGAILVVSPSICKTFTTGSTYKGNYAWTSCHVVVLSLLLLFPYYHHLIFIFSKEKFQQTRIIEAKKQRIWIQHCKLTVNTALVKSTQFVQQETERKMGKDQHLNPTVSLVK